MASAEKQPISFAVDVRRMRANAVTVDALARLQIAAKRTGCQVTYCGASTELQELLAFMGLDDVLVAEP